MRLRTVLVALGCCAGLTACAASAPKGPNVSVTPPAVGHPQPPSSAEAALSRDAFSPYAALGQSSNDGLAPGQSNYALGQACMSDAGYPNSTAGVPFSISAGPANLAFAQPWGNWGYLSGAEAQQYGFMAPPGNALTELGIDAPPANPGNLSAAEQSAAGKCGTIVQSFTTRIDAGPLATLETLTNDIVNAVSRDAAVKQATRAWSVCMTRNGYRFGAPGNVFFTELNAMHGGQRSISPTEPVSPAARQAQLTAAVTDANCTQSADLAGIYFAVLASYEQQIVNANQQELTAAVHRFRTEYQQESRRLPTLLRTAKATPFRGPKSRDVG
jgi:hypothetical protein